MNSDLPATGTVALLELVNPFVPDDFINACWPRGLTGRQCVAVFLNQEKVESEQRHEQQGQHHYVKREEALHRVFTHRRAAANNTRDYMPGAACATSPLYSDSVELRRVT